MNVKTFFGYITDLDGTLCDTRLANALSYKQAFEDANLPFNETTYHDNFGLRYKEMMDFLAPQADAGQLQTIADRKAHHYAANLNLITLNEDLVRLLYFVKKNGAKTGLVTTARKTNALSVLRHFNLDEFFTCYIFGEDVVAGKPDPECYLHALKSLRLQADRCLIFEDSNVGIEAARSAGAHTVKVSL